MSTNGRLPVPTLTTIGGVQLAHATARAWAALVVDVKRATGVTLVISPNGGYRSFEQQRDLYGTGHHKAPPGTSVHGHGTAVDIWNWPDVKQTVLDAHAARHGFRRTIAHEPWHYQHDGTTTPASVELEPIEDEDDTMKNAGFYYKRSGRTINIIANTVSGFFHEFESDSGGYNTAVGKAFDVPASFAEISGSHADKLRADCAAIRSR